MPKVGGKHYSYTPAGKQAAKKTAKETGMPMMSDSKMEKMPMKGKKMPMKGYGKKK